MLVDFAENDIGFGGADFMAELLKAQDYERNTALHLAVDSGHYDIVKFLLEKGT